MHVSSVSSTFKGMLQVLHLNVSKVDQILHLPPRFLLSRPGRPGLPPIRGHNATARAKKA
jgi:hypothetical protein